MPHSQQTVPLADCSAAAGWSDASAPSDSYEMVDINEMVTRGADHFVHYRVTGESMFPKYPPGCIVFVDPTVQPNDGDAVVVVLNDQVCVKSFETRPRLRLVSLNESFGGRDVTERDDFSVIGVVKAGLVFASISILTVLAGAF